MTATLLSLNAGSSSIKFALFALTDPPRELMRGQVEGLGAAPTFKAKSATGDLWADTTLDPSGRPFHEAALGAIIALLEDRLAGAPVVAVGHRIVHGGSRYVQSVVVDATVMADLTTLAPLAPLHQPHNLTGIAAAMRVFPDALQVACFDTAFHRTHDRINDTYALPRQFYDEGVRRYGFHGLSYAYVTGALAAIDPVAARGRLVIAHLGNGASMCAVRHGKAVATTMGFSPLDGLAMGTRTGQLDPSVVFYLARQHAMSLDDIETLLYRRSGLLGISGLSSDMRTLEAAGTPAAEDAIAYFVHTIRREIGALAATLGGLDTLVFTGGIGENAVRVRERVCADMEWLGLRLDKRRNRRHCDVISADRSRVTVRRLPTNEEIFIAHETVRLLHASTTAPNSPSTTTEPRS